MVAKKLEAGSELAQLDHNGDGTVYDVDIEQWKEQKAMELADRKQKQQRYMAWYALVGMISYPIMIVGTEVLGLSNASTLLADMAPTYFIAAAGVAGAFMGFAAMGSKKSGK